LRELSTSAVLDFKLLQSSEKDVIRNDTKSSNSLHSSAAGLKVAYDANKMRMRHQDDAPTRAYLTRKTKAKTLTRKQLKPSVVKL